jgi:hypothetical protein
VGGGAIWEGLEWDGVVAFCVDFLFNFDFCLVGSGRRCSDVNMGDIKNYKGKDGLDEGIALFYKS